MPPLTKKTSLRIGLGSVALVTFLLIIIFMPHYHKHSHRIVFIKPTFTIAAYQPRGFYDYYRGNCSTKCLTVSTNPREHTRLMNYAGSKNALEKLESLGINDEVTDEQVTENPFILNGYDKVIILHNEYVSQAEFRAITAHPNVLYLYPNALYALVSYDQKDGTITLQKGHGFGGINNAFNWVPSMSTKEEYNTACKDWQFNTAINGIVLNCYPEFDILHDAKLWAAIVR
jgi:hypothetical protein